MTNKYTITCITCGYVDGCAPCCPTHGRPLLCQDEDCHKCNSRFTQIKGGAMSDGITDAFRAAAAGDYKRRVIKEVLFNAFRTVKQTYGSDWKVKVFRMLVDFDEKELSSDRRERE